MEKKRLMYDFSQAASREETNAEKYTLRERLFGTVDVEPVWVADMDINTPDFVLKSVKQRLEHPIVGYEEVPHSAYKAQAEWLQRRHGLSVSLEDMFHSHSVVASMSVIIEAFSEEGDEVIVQTPVYPPFFHSVTEHGRKLLKNSLIQNSEGKYVFDIDRLKVMITPKTKLLLLCSPHNPVGRVWSREELEEIANICYKNNIVVFSDEIHSDIVYAGKKHTPFAMVSQKAAEISLSAFGVGKTFNMAGFAMSSVVVQNPLLKEKFEKVYKRVHFAGGNALSHVAFERAYKEGDLWLEELKIHLWNNYETLCELSEEYKELIQIIPLEATYLAWLDCRGMELKDKELRDFFVEEAKLGLNAGISFGREGSGFMRLNFAVSSAKMSLIIERLRNALETLRNKRGKH
ncbi:MAG: PatB family C-S lyase [Campylobacterales bacterium]|nr:PatB family C-S lyase [Campylobacterales bacterium]